MKKEYIEFSKEDAEALGAFEEEALELEDLSEDNSEETNG